MPNIDICDCCKAKLAVEICTTKGGTVLNLCQYCAETLKEAGHEV